MHRHNPLQYAIDKWNVFRRNKVRLNRLLFKLYLRWHANNIGPAFILWSRVSEAGRLRKLQLTRVFRKIENLKASQAFNKWFHTTKEAEKKDAVCVAQAFLNWLDYLQRRHRMKWLLLKMSHTTLRDLSRECFKIWHLVAHRRADKNRFESQILEARTHISHLTVRSSGLASRFHSHHHRHFSVSSLAKVIAAWAELVQAAKKRMMLVERCSSKVKFRFRQQALRAWRESARRKRSGAKKLCLALRQRYTLTLSDNLSKWVKVTDHWHKLRMNVGRNIDKLSREHLKRAFIRLRETSNKGKGARAIGALLRHVFREMLLKKFCAWKWTTKRMIFLARMAEDKNAQHSSRTCR